MCFWCKQGLKLGICADCGHDNHPPLGGLVFSQTKIEPQEPKIWQE